MAFHPQRILVTGGAGFIGSNFLRALLETEEIRGVVNLDLLTYAGSLDHLKGLPQSDNYRFIRGDISNDALLDELFCDHQFDTVIHFAAESHVDRSIGAPGAFIQTNLVGTWTLLEAARKHWLTEPTTPSTRRFHHVSTDEVYGALDSVAAPFDENAPYRPNSPYSASKAGADHLVRSYHHTFGLPVTQSNCSNNYGPNQHDEKLIPTVVRNCVRGQTIPVYGDGLNVRDWLHVDDHCQAILDILHKGRIGGVYNVGGDNELDNLSLIRMICAIMDEQVPKNAPHEKLIGFVTDRPGHDWRYAIDATRIKRELGWRPQTPFRQGLAETIRDLRQRYG